MFPNLQTGLIDTVLAANNWNVDAAILPLFNEAEKIKNEERRKQEEKRKEEEGRRQQEEYEQQVQHLREIFEKDVSSKRVQQILDDNEGDIEETTTELLEIVAKQEEEKRTQATLSQKQRETVDKTRTEMIIPSHQLSKEQEEKRLNEIKVQALSDKFDNVKESEVIDKLKANDWNVKKALLDLMALSNNKKKTDVNTVFPLLSDNEVQNALTVNEWNVMKTVQYIQAKREIHQNNASMSPIVTKIERDVMILGEQLEMEITQSQIREEEVKKDVKKKALEHIIGTQARSGYVPGLHPPPSPKHIDQIVGKKKGQPVLEEPQSPTTNNNVYEQQPAPACESPKGTLESTLAVQLTATPVYPDIGNVITVQYEITNGQTSPYDWVGLYPIDSPNKNYTTYQWTGRDKTKGSLTFAAPSPYGDYQFRYFPGSTYQHAAMSNVIKVGPQILLQAHFDSLAPNKLCVRWNKLSGNEYSRAWIGLYEKTQADSKQYLTWEYANKPSNELIFDVPIKPQQYQFRFFANSYLDVVRSNVVVVEGEDTLSAELKDNTVTVKPHIVTVDPHYDSAWVGLYFVSETNNRQWRRYKYVYDRNTQIEFKAPKTPGEYEARLFVNKTYDLLLKSNTFTISPPQHL